MSAEQSVLPVVLAGGAGKRLWPLSRAWRPKQFLSLNGELSSFQQTLLRLKQVPLFLPPIIVTNMAHRFLAAEQAREVGVTPSQVILEPVSRNTLPAICVACLAVFGEGQDPLVHVVASDHVVGDLTQYERAVRRAIDVAGTRDLVTLGIAPEEPATGFGYICGDEQVADGVFRVARFVEKPDVEHARALMAQPGTLWNSGMFVFSANALLAECARLAPEVLAVCRTAVDGARKETDFVWLEDSAFAESPDISIDYAILEKTDRALVVVATFPWRDLGSWRSIRAACPQDAAGNGTVGPVSLQETVNSLVVSRTLRVCVTGLQDVAVIAEEDVIYVGPLDREACREPGAETGAETKRKPMGDESGGVCSDAGMDEPKGRE